MDAKRPTNVVLVEDDNATRMIGQRQLERAGFKVVAFSGGESFLESIERTDFDVVLLDVLMPDMNGFEVCQRLRNHTNVKKSKLPVVMMTGLDDLESIEHAYQVGATDFTIKPINWKIVSHRIEHIRHSHEILTELHNTIEKLDKSEKGLKDAQSLAHLGNWQWDPSSQDMQWSNQMYEILGYKPNVRSSYDNFLKVIHADEQYEVDRNIQTAMNEGKDWFHQNKIILANGEERYIEQQIQAEKVNGSYHLSGTIQDITDRITAENKIWRLSYFDELTNLPNRQYCQELLKEQIQLSQQKDTKVAIISIDLDRFKIINDSFGQKVGDDVLCLIAERIQKCIRTSSHYVRGQDGEEKAVIARLAGDEFVALIPNLIHAHDAAKVALRIIESMQQPIQYLEQDFSLSCSMGISIFPEDGDTPQTLLKHADTAMFHAKDVGRNNYQFYASNLNARALERLSIESNLRKAVSNQDFVLYYQPKIDVSTMKIIGAEALIRWQHAEMGLVSPVEFIPIAEDTGLIDEIGEWVLRTACKDVQHWLDAFPDFKISVNVSGQQFKRHDLSEEVHSIVKEMNFPPHNLELEITESVMMDQIHTESQILQELVKSGIEFSIDDFGTGYSSLSYLKQLPLSTIKIDRSFVKDLPNDPENEAIIKAIISIAENLNLKIIAEGVETQAQLEYLQSHGCNQIQGYHISRPLPFNEADQFIRNWK